MKKLFTNLLAAFSLALVGSGAAMAETFTFTNGVVELGKVYEVPAFVDVEATLTAPSTGTLVQDGVADIKLVGVDATSLGFTDYGQAYSYQVEEGVTYDVRCDFVMNGGNVVFRMESDMGVELTEAIPAAGSVITSTVNYTGDVILRFNTAVKCESAMLVAAEAEAALRVPMEASNALALNVKDALNALYANGAIDKEGGSSVKLRVAGLQSASGLAYGEDGSLELEYVAGAKALDLISTNCHEGFMMKSYYPAGDPAGILTFTFDGDLLNDGTAYFSILCGDVENDNAYAEDIKPQIDGATAIVDLTGKLRDLNRYPMLNNMFAAKLGNIRNTKGELSAGSGSGNVGSYAYTFVYDYIKPVNITSEFVPATGSSLAGVSGIEIWFNNSGSITYDGVKMIHPDGVIIVPKDDLSIELAGDETTIKVALPAELQSVPVTVTLDNLVSLDGYDHTSQVSARYNQAVFQLLAPIHEGESIASTGNDDFVLRTNIEPGYMRYDFYNHPTADSPDGWAYGSWFTKQDDGTWTAYNMDYVCYNNFTPHMWVRAYESEADYWNGGQPIGEADFTFIGTTRGFEYSTVRFESIDPADNSTLVGPFDDFYFTVKFDGMVSINPAESGIVLGMGLPLQHFEKIEAANLGDGDLEGYANTWKLYPGNSYMNGNESITITVRAYDEDGMLVEGSFGSEDNDYLNFFYLITNADKYREVSLMPAEGTVAELSMLIAYADQQAVGINYACEEAAVIYNKVRDIVYTFSSSDIEVEADVVDYDEEGNPVFSEITTVVMYINPAITEGGEYTVAIPAGFFIVGSQFDTAFNQEIAATYTIEGGSQSQGVVLDITPASGSTVESLDRITFCNQYMQPNWEVNEPITISNANGEVVFSATNEEVISDFDWDTWEDHGYYIEPNITEAGTYTLKVPAKFFDIFPDFSEAAECVYIVTGNSGINGILLDKADSYEVYNLQGMRVLSTANAADLLNLRGIYVVNGKKVRF